VGAPHRPTGAGRPSPAKGDGQAGLRIQPATERALDPTETDELVELIARVLVGAPAPLAPQDAGRKSQSASAPTGEA
jgi:hypothetical protein